MGTSLEHGCDSWRSWIEALGPESGLFRLAMLLLVTGHRRTITVSLNGFMRPTFDWRYAFGTGAALGLIILFLRKSVPESPRWLMLRGREEEAGKIRGDIEKKVSEEKGDLKEAEGKPEDLGAGSCAVYHYNRRRHPFRDRLVKTRIAAFWAAGMIKCPRRYISLRFSSDRDMLTSSANSRSLPTGMPIAIRVTRGPSGFSRRDK